MSSILIIGSGALATAYASKLSQNPEIELQLFCEWQEGIQAIQEKGILCHNRKEIINTQNIYASVHADTINPADLILVLVKSWQTDRVVSKIKNKLKPDGICLTLQNGLGNLQILRQLFPHDQVLAGTTMLGAELLAPAEVKINFLGSMQIEEHPAADWVLPVFQQSGFDIQTNPDLESVLWGKLLINAIVNPLTAIFEQRNGILISSIESLALMDAMIDEILLLIKKKDIHLPYGDAHRQVRLAVQQTAENLSSMAQDWKRNAPTEIDNITGAILKEAQEYRIRMPVNQTIYQLIKAGLATKNL
jgi:2-dehydropantoate 2-reductase